MIGINRKTLKEDYELLSELRDKYQNAIWEGQEGQPAHFDNQHKMVKMAMCDVRTGLNIIVMALQLNTYNEQVSGILRLGSNLLKQG